MYYKKILIWLIAGSLLGSCNLDLPTFSLMGDSFSLPYYPANTVVNKTGTLIIAKAQARRFNTPLPLVLGVITQESGFNVTAVSRAGALGLMQIMPDTITHINKASPVQISSAFNPAQNIAGGTWYLHWLYSKFGNWPEKERWKLALASYNGGLGRVLNNVRKIAEKTQQSPYQVQWQDIAPYMPGETRSYVPAVLYHANSYQYSKTMGSILN